MSELVLFYAKFRDEESAQICDEYGIIAYMNGEKESQNKYGKLFAAAPDLLEACIDLVALDAECEIENECCNDGECVDTWQSTELGSIISAMRKAIQKAGAE